MHFYGGSIDEYGDALIIGANDDIYIAGPCNSPNGLTTPGTHQQVIGVVSMPLLPVSILPAPDYGDRITEELMMMMRMAWPLMKINTSI